MTTKIGLDAAALSVSRFLPHPVDMPQLLRVRREGTTNSGGSDPAARTAAALRPHLARVGVGSRIAVAVGSRGIADLVPVVQATVDVLRDLGAEPFIVPAMGSHGGATADGQQHLLARLGIIEREIHAPVRATMETVALGRVGDIDVHFDAEAANADGVLLINRIKSHTSFTGDIESGIAKMLSIGLGKQQGAEQLHRLGPNRLEDRLCRVARHIAGHANVLGGIALVEDESKHLAEIEFLTPDDIAGDREKALLVTAKTLAPRLPVDHIDVLVVDQFGKDRSGTGMDTNVIGRRMIHGVPDPATPVITNIVALELTAQSDGNAVGMGLADFVSARFLESLDLAATYGNALTAGLQGVQRAQLPIVLATDRDAIAAALLVSGLQDPAQARMVRIRDTLSLENVMISANLLDECKDRGYSPMPPGRPTDLSFLSDQTIAPFDAG